MLGRVKQHLSSNTNVYFERTWVFMGENQKKNWDSVGDAAKKLRISSASRRVGQWARERRY